VLASHAGRRALAAVGIALVTIGWTGAPAAAVELPPVSLPPVTLLPPLPPLELPAVTIPAVAVPTTAPTIVAGGGATTNPPTAAPTTTAAAVPPAASAVTTTTTAAPVRPTIAVTVHVPSAGGTVVTSPPLRTVASERARQFAFPFTLALLVVGFLAVQHRVGTNDPRLVAAPIDDDRRRFS
jgi:hypothetical protein